MRCPECNSNDLEEDDFLIYHSDGNDYICRTCGCEFGIFQKGTESEEEAES